MKPADKLKIFVVDDDAFCLYMFERHLTNLGYKKVKTFDNGSDCLDNLAEKPDVIFLDHNMADISGIDVLKTIKRFLPDVHIVFISGQERVETVIQAMQLGAYEYIFKGEYELENISKVMNKIIEMKFGPEKKTGLFNKFLSF